MTHFFDTKIAEKYGIEEAIIFQNIQYWIKENQANERNFYDGKYWTFNTAKAFCELFPYMSKDKIGRILRNLVTDGLLVTGNYNEKKYDRTLWYALGENAISMLQECKMDVAKVQNGSCENASPIPYINTDIKPYINTNNNTMSTNVDDVFKANEFLEYFKKICPSLPQPKEINDKRRKAINTIIRKYGKDDFANTLKMVEESDFLTGRNGAWNKCSLDWIIKSSNYVKIREGNYTNTGKNIKEKELEIREREIAHKERIEEEYLKDLKKRNQNNLEQIAEISTQADRISNLSQMIWGNDDNGTNKHINSNNKKLLSSKEDT